MSDPRHQIELKAKDVSPAAAENINPVKKPISGRTEEERAEAHKNPATRQTKRTAVASPQVPARGRNTPAMLWITASTNETSPHDRPVGDLYPCSQKMESLGQLTGGIAHDFNNMLGVMVGSLALIRRRLKNGDLSVERFIDAANNASERAAVLTQRLLAFARQQPLAPQPLDGNKVIVNMSDLLRSTLGEQIRIETVAAAGLWTLHADAQQLENAILNIAVNARDARQDGGKLTIETGNAYLDDAYCRQLCPDNSS